MQQQQRAHLNQINVADFEDQSGGDLGYGFPGPKLGKRRIRECRRSCSLLTCGKIHQNTMASSGKAGDDTQSEAYSSEDDEG